MKLSHLICVLGLFAGTACTAERALGPQPSVAGAAASIAAATSQVPLLYVVDGVRLQRDQVPSLTENQIATVRVIKGHEALKLYGSDASYGVVVITTRAAASPRS